jgi:hypothetical protein
VENVIASLKTFESDQKYRLLLEITNAMVTHLDRDALFHAIAQELQKGPTFDRTGITLFDPISRTIFRSMP